MKNLFIALHVLLCFFSTILISHAQTVNHVPNCSFEQYTQCPTSTSQVNRCTSWRQYTSATSDFFHACGSLAPTNFAGYQHAAHGQGYTGGYFYNKGDSRIYKEYIAATITPLIIGGKYEVSVSVSLSNKSRFGTNDVGVYFYDSGATTLPGVQGVLSVTPQIDYSSYGVIMDTANWVRLTKTFIADSAYDNIVIGGFKHYNNLTLDSITTNTATYAYYYIDSVVIRLIDSFHAFIADSMLCVDDTFQTYYNTSKDYNSNNTFTAQLSDKTGSFANPVNIGSLATDTSGTITCIIPATISPATGYRVRVIASSPSDTTKNLSPALKIGNPDSTNISVSSNSPLCQGFTLQFSASTFVSGTSYSWTGPNSFSSTSPNPFINGATPIQNGNYFVTMKWYGCEVTDTAQVTVKPLPAKPVATGNSPLCAGETLNLTAASSTSGVSYSWAGPASFTSSVQNPSISNTTTAMSGDYIVTANLNGCTNKDTATVTVNPQPAAVTLSSTPSPTGCTGDTLYLNSTASSTGVSYTWTGPNSFTANTQNASIPNTTTAATGWYKMTATLNSCSYMDSIYAAINPIPATPVASYNNPLCIGETLGLAASTVSGATYTWNGPSNFNSNTQNPSRSNSSFSDTGTYTVTATVSGCTSPAASVKVGINPVPFVVIFPTPADSICQGNAVTFTALPNNAGATPQYRWVVNGQTAGTNSTGFTTSTLNDQDIVRCDMTENTKCSSPYTDQSNDITMRVLPWLAPSVTISASPNRPLNVDEYVTFTATPTNAGPLPTYQWKRNGLDVQGATGSVWSANTLNDNDSISVEVFSNYKCPQPTTASSNGIRVRVLTSVNGIGEIKGLILYPNPNNGKFVLKGNVADNAVYNIEIINALGQVVYKDNATALNGTIHKEIRLSNITGGIYMLKLIADNEVVTTRFSVE
jgi:hypothetical protein